MTNKLKSSQLKNYIKLPVLLSAFLILKDSFSEKGLQTKVKRLLSKKPLKPVLNIKLLSQRAHFQKTLT